MELYASVCLVAWRRRGAVLLGAREEWLSNHIHHIVLLTSWKCYFFECENCFRIGIKIWEVTWRAQLSSWCIGSCWLNLLALHISIIAYLARKVFLFSFSTIISGLVNFWNWLPILFCTGYVGMQKNIAEVMYGGINRVHWLPPAL